MRRDRPAAGYVLILDSAPADAALAARLVGTALGVEAVPVEEAAAFANRLARGGFSAVVTGLELGWATAEEVVAAVRDLYPECPIVVLAPDVPASRLAAALEAGASAFVPKTSEGYLRLADTLGRRLGAPASPRGPASSHAGTTPGPGAELPPIVDRLPVGVFTCTGEGSILRANPALAAMLGAGDPRTLAGRCWVDLFADAAARDLWRFLAERRSPARDLEVRIQRPDGSRRWLSLTFWWTEDAGGGRYEGAAEDCTHAKEAREELSRQAAALERSNEELEQYAHVVSHDLQEPLQLVTRYARLLEEAWSDERKEGKGRRYLEHVVGSAERMQAMIDDILAYSRSGAGARPAEPMALDAALDTALANLEASIEEAGAEIRRDSLPTVAGDAGGMTQVFQNLVANAIKFRGDGPPRIRIGAEDREDEWAVFVKDNGIGIAPEDQDRVFQMFERLHPATRYPGSGIGLAICKRIVERHGGVLSVTSREGEGSTFWVRLPKSDGEARPGDSRNPVEEGDRAWTEKA